MKQLAIYGKGGIGKSTISANLSAALAQCSLRVLQIGCDPKHDSTRLLLGGTPQPTVLDMLKENSLTLADLLRVGYGGVHCLEAGGPEPGVGCAGRGILSMAQTLEKVGLNKDTYDLVLYDVLGDVVCGGFAVPMRDDYADAILIVTSGELMAVYAANNICKGLRHFTSKGGKLAGIIGNERQIPRERELIEAFAHAVGSHMLAFFPRDPAFREAELHRKTIVELFPESPLTHQFLTLAEQVRAGLPAVVPQPLNEQAFEELIYTFAEGQAPRNRWGGKTGRGAGGAGGEPKGSGVVSLSGPRRNSLSAGPPDVPQPKVGGWEEEGEAEHSRVSSGARSVANAATPPTPPREAPGTRYASKAVQQKEPLYSCALAGAFAVSNQLRDALTIMHAPSGCAHTSLDAAWLSAAGLEEKSHGQVERQLTPNLLCTNFTEQEAVFGGEPRLKETIARASERLNPQAMFIITSCPTAIIGDDAGRVARELSTPNCPVIPLETDGIMKGDYAQGWINAYRNIAEALIDPSLQPEEGLVNIVGETTVANNSENNFAEMRRILEALGLTILTRFLRNTTVAAARHFKRAALNILGSSDSPARAVQRLLKERFGAVFVEEPFPSGLTDTSRWVLTLAQRLHREPAAHELLASARRSYEQRLQRVRPFLIGKSALIFAYTSNLSWLTEALQDAEIQIQRLCVVHSAINDDGVLGSRASVPVVGNYPVDQRERDVHDHCPDLVLSNYALRGIFPGTAIATIPLCPPLGFFAGLTVLEHLARKIRASHFTEGWRDDRTSRRELLGQGAGR